MLLKVPTIYNFTNLGSSIQNIMRNIPFPKQTRQKLWIFYTAYGKRMKDNHSTKSQDLTIRTGKLMYKHLQYISQISKESNVNSQQWQHKYHDDGEKVA